MNKALRIVTRKSQLALWQATYVKEQLQIIHPNLDISIIGISTTGDKILETALSKIGGKGLFVKELEEKLLNNEADIAVHSMKDVPAELPEELEIAAILEREDPRDAFVSLHYPSIESLPALAKLGTSSLRRQAQVSALRGDLRLQTLRGNVDTRLKKLLNQEFEGIILAVSGLKRLKLEAYIREYLTIDTFLPCVGQGALGIECRKNDTVVETLIKPLSHEASTVCVLAERSMNALLGGSCQLPVAGFGSIQDTVLQLTGMVASLDGKRILKARKEGSPNEAIQLGQQLAKSLLEQGASEIIEQCKRGSI